MVMKICIVSEREYGCGASIAAFRLARSLAESDHEVHYVFREPMDEGECQKVNTYCLGQKQPFWNQVIHNVLYVTSAKMRFRYNCYQSYKELLSLMKRIQPDVINLHNVGTMLTHDAVTHLGYKYPIVWTMHDFFAIRPYCYQFMNGSGRVTETSVVSPEFVEHGARDRLIASQSSIHFVAPSQWLGGSVMQELAGKKEVLTIPHGLSNQEFFPEDQSVARRSLGLSLDSFYLLFVASALEYERKNIHVLLEALEMMRNPEIRVLALGNVSSEFRNEHSYIRFFDADFAPKKLRRLYSAADIFVIPSLVDNLPNTVLETLFCGTAVLGADVGGIPEMVVPDETGWLFDPRDPRGLADKLSRIYQEREMLAKTRETCSNWVQRHFSIENQRDQYLKLFRKIVDEKRTN
jgi:glycosyltransferase involved in cell wall biosynthesis